VIPDSKAESLAACLSKLSPNKDFPLIWPGCHLSPAALESGIRGSCSEIIPLALETESTAEWDARLKEGLAADPPDFIVFSGRSEVQGFVELLGQEAASDLVCHSCIVAMEETAAAALQGYGLFCHLALKNSDPANFIEALAGC